MDLVLNLVWVMLALASFVAWRKHSCTGPRARVVTSLLALGCLLILIFPVISASDDLHYSELAAEDATSSRKILQALQVEKAPTQAVHLSAPAIAVQPLSAPILRELSLLTSNNHTCSPVLLNHSLPDRAPPASLV
jgi:hypothetical protein